MLVVMLALWTIGAILIFTDPDRESTRWASATAFVGGIGFCAAVINELVRPYLWVQGWNNPTLDSFFQILSISCSFICQNGLPYAFLMYAICYSDRFHAKTRKVLMYSSATPIILMLIITPLYPVLTFNYVIFTLWAGPYIVGAAFLLIASYLQERNPMMRKSRLFTNIVAIFPMVTALFTIYILRIFHIDEAWRYNVLVIALQFVIFILFGIRHGVLGVKLKSEKQRIGGALRALHSGAAIVNHTLKDEIGKIRLIANQYETAEMKTIVQSTNHLMNMVERIQEQTQDFIIKRHSHSLSVILTQAIDSIRPLAQINKIQISNHVPTDIQMWCDSVHLQEVFNNILKNAIESMNVTGLLTIEMNLTKKNLIISIVDNGRGISAANLPYVFDPFFTTKDRSKNYGLGLSYCYTIMQKHGGSIGVHSEPDMGTAIYLHFPKKSLIDSFVKNMEGELSYESDKSVASGG